MSNFAIGVIEAPTSIATGHSVAAATGTSSLYPFNSEPGLVFRSATNMLNTQVLQWDLDFGKQITAGMLGLFGLPEITTFTTQCQLSNTALGGTDVANINNNANPFPFSTNHTASARKQLWMFSQRYTFRYARFTMVATANQTLPVEISRIAFCDVLQPVTNVEWGFKFEADDTSKFDISDLGYDEVVEQRILPMMTGTIPWGSVAEEPRMRQLVYRAGNSREVVACLDPADTTWGEDKLIWGRFKSGVALTLTDYDINTLDFSIRAIAP